MHAILTGHSRGLGAAICTRLLECDAQVLGLARTPLQSEAPDSRSALRQHLVDLADPAELQKWLETGGLVDFLANASQAILINNAGTIEPVAPGGRQGGASIARAVALNIAAPLILADAFVAATEHCADRRILHVSSGAARSAYAGWSVYCATKAALDQHACAFSADRIARLRVASVAPGVIDTDMQSAVRDSSREAFPQVDRFRRMKAEGQLQPPAECARRLVQYLLSESFGATPTADLRTV